MLKVNHLSGFGAGGIDPNAQAFIVAAGITDSTQKRAIDRLVKNLKGYGIWTKCLAIYPFVGGTSTTHKFNLKDPRDLDAAFRLAFAGTITHDANGITPGGTTADYADTFFDPVTQSSSLTSFHLSLYKGATSANGTSRLYMGQWVSPGFNVTYLGWASAGTLERAGIGVASNGTDNTPTAGTSAPSTAGMVAVSCNGDRDQKYYLNGSAHGTSVTSTGTFVSSSLFIGAANDTGAAVFPYNQSTRFVSIGTGLTAAEAGNLFTACEAFQDALGRGVI